MGDPQTLLVLCIRGAMPRSGGYQVGRGPTSTQAGTCVCMCVDVQAGICINKERVCVCVHMGGGAVLGAVHMHKGCLYVHTRWCGCIYPPLGVTP